MEFIKFVDATGKQWILNKAFIVGMTPTFGSGFAPIKPDTGTPLS